MSTTKNFQREERVKFNSNKKFKESVSLMELPETPMEEDYISIPFRALSATVVGMDSYKATDFSIEGVLRGAVDKLVGKPIYLDHSLWRVENAIGVVESAEFQEQTTDTEGRIIPAGINVVMKVDAKANPRVARALIHEKPYIFSCSVTVTYLWKPSHASEDFRWRIGDIDEETGTIICRQAVEILDFYEISLVWAGADPFAKMLKDERPYLIDWTSAPTPEQMPSPVTQVPSSEDGILDKAFENNTLETHQEQFSNEPNEPNQGQTDQTAELQTQVHQFKTESEEKQKSIDELEAKRKELETLLQEKESKIISLQSNENNLSSEIQEITAKYTNLETQFNEVKTKYNVFLDKKREECKRLYLLASKGKQSEGILSIIEKADETELNSLLESYGGSFVDNANLTCSGCGKKVDYRTTVVEEPLNIETKKHVPQGSKMFIRKK